MFLDDNGVQVLQWEDMVPLGDIDVFDGRDGLVVTSKVDWFVRVIRKQGFRQPLTGRRLKNGRIKLICGHHRRRAAEILGLSFIPMILLTDDMPDSLGVDIYLEDNSVVTNLCTPLLLSAVRIADLNRQPGLSDSEHDAATGGKIGFKGDQVRDTRKINAGLDAGTVIKAIKDIKQPYTAVKAYRLFVKHNLSLELQQGVFDAIQLNTDDGLQIMSRKISEDKKKAEAAALAATLPELVTLSKPARVRSIVEDLADITNKTKALVKKIDASPADVEDIVAKAVFGWDANVKNLAYRLGLKKSTEETDETENSEVA